MPADRPSHDREGTPPSSSSCDYEGAKLAYGEICRSHLAITDFRAKLLALLPVASGAAGLALVRDGLKPQDTWAAPLGLFGAVVTLGLFIYELRQIQECKRLREKGRIVECRLRVPQDCGQFRDPQPAPLHGLISVEMAGWIVYSTVIVGWLLLAGVGLKWWGNSGYEWAWVLVALYAVGVGAKAAQLVKNGVSKTCTTTTVAEETPMEVQSPVTRTSQGDGGDSPEAPLWIRPAFIGTVAGGVAALVFGFGLLLSLDAAAPEEAKGINASLPGPLFAFAGAVVITGVVGVWVSAAGRRLDEHRRKADALAEREREHRAFLESQIVALWGVHECLKTSAVLISAHRTAKTYSDQVKEIIAARTRLSDVADTVKRRQAPLVTPKDFAEFQGHAETAAAFLHPLVDEFRKNFLDKLSYAQRVDEAENRKLDDAANFDPHARSIRVWTTLRKDADFVAVQKLLDFGDLSADDLRVGSTSWDDSVMTKEFLKPLKAAIGVLVSCQESRAAPRPIRHLRL